MIIEKISIKKFRGFEDVEFDLGSLLTVISGQNGTQKTTLLGLLSQPFTITDKDNPMKDEKPLCGGNFKSAFNEKFKLSQEFDKVKTHEWTLFLKNEKEPFILESIKRGKENIRFWRKSDRKKGSGYIQLPVIYLSLSRLLPIGEDRSLKESETIKLTDNEQKFYTEWHNKLLIIISETIETTNYLESTNKNTIGVNTNLYDWKQNSAGQDNIGKIILAILSFKRLKEKYPEHYKGGLLAIDELDSTLYPASQIKLFEALRKFASNYNIQIIFTTHSLSILEKACNLQKDLEKTIATQNQLRVVFLEKLNSKVKVIPAVSFHTIKHRLNLTLSEKKNSKIDVFTEDMEAAIFVKALLKSKKSKLNFIKCTMSCGSLMDLANRKIPSFTFPNSIIFLDGDVKQDPKNLRKISGLKNIILLPSRISPERTIAEFLYNLDDESDVWQNIDSNFNKQYCFQNYNISEIQNDREKAKKWFNEHKELWGTNCVRVINPWARENIKEVDQFLERFKNVYNNFAKELSIQKM